MNIAGPPLFVAALALSSLHATGLAAMPPAGRWMLVPTCHGGLVPVPLDGPGGSRDDDRRPSATACHALCLRTSDEDSEGQD